LAGKVVTFVFSGGIRGTGFRLWAVSFTIAAVLSPTNKLLLITVLATGVAAAQEPAAQKPQVRVNYLNVCAPSDTEKTELAAALAKVPAKPHFAKDFEVSRGLSSMDDSAIVAGLGAQMEDQAPSVSRWVRVRREFPKQSVFSNAQYSFSVGESRVSETLTLKVRDPKDLMQVTISDSVNAPLNPGQVATMETPADRVRLERFGKSSVALARCKEADQSKYEPLFKTASVLLQAYRQALGVPKTVPGDLARIPSGTPPAAAAKTKKK
jgi:hypothetical protein